MKMLGSLIVTLYFLTFLAVSESKADESLAYCDQQLLQASASCSDSNSLESCIVTALAGTDCKLEIATEDEIDICNESCAPHISRSAQLI